MLTRRARRGALAAMVAAALGAGAIAGAALAAKPPVKKTLTASGFELTFNRTALRARPGKVKLVLINRSDFDHNVAIRGNGLKAKRGRVVNRGGVSSVTVTVKPGRYTFFCSVSGHEAAGMKGTLTVRARR
jgi:plastocyanin